MTDNVESETPIPHATVPIGIECVDTSVLPPCLDPAPELPHTGVDVGIILAIAAALTIVGVLLRFLTPAPVPAAPGRAPHAWAGPELDQRSPE